VEPTSFLDLVDFAELANFTELAKLMEKDRTPRKRKKQSRTLGKEVLSPDPRCSQTPFIY